MIESGTLLRYITSAKINDGKWKGTTEGFILHWQDQLRIYHNQVDAKEHFPSTMKHTILQNAVHPIEELRQVKNNCDLERAKTGRTMDYDAWRCGCVSVA